MNAALSALADFSPLTDLPCYLNGAITPLKDAKISVMDRGFIFGDGIYEVVPAYGGKLFRFAQHMARLERSLAELRIPNPHTRQAWRDIAMELIAAHARFDCANSLKDPNIAAPDTILPASQLIYIQISRGVPTSGQPLRDHPMLPGLTPTVFMFCNVMKPPTAEQRKQGVACVTARDFRWEKAHIKSTSLLGAVLSRQISFDAGALETIMFRGDYLSEAAASNVWIVQGGQVLGVPNDELVLEGIRYGLIEEICRAAGVPFALRRITRAEVLAADEIWLSSATKEVLPVTQLDGHAVGNGKPGPLYAKIHTAYQQAKTAEASAQAQLT